MFRSSSFQLLFLTPDRSQGYFLQGLDKVLEEGFVILVAEWIHFTLFGILSPTIKLKVYTFGSYELSN